ncbi:PREDICTED: F-box/WD repeat-containing protein pof1 [Tarenaya hassleriana]|uniref:F-box/WD repeat-containing protein pof1 n=1 Tax=Tarenaya hassleriana TaxID=28532 RepID=UPI00053C6641|nr:PREDICTED: F-box/WD repeat-containing protein pof1 [Tarenaya hassleriana]
MGLFPCSCPLPCNKTRECQNNSTHLQSDFSTSSSLSSQPSLPSVPSLSSPSQNRHHDHQCLVTLRGHSSYVSSLAVSGKFIYSGSSDGKILAWPREPPENIAGDNTVAVGNGAVKAMVVFRYKLITAHQDHKIRVWKIEERDPPQKYKCVATLPTANDRFTKIFSGKNYVEVRRHKKCTWVHHLDTVSSLALSKDGSLLYSASWDRTFKIWRTSDFRCLESKEKAHEDAINAVVVSCDGFVYTGSADKKIKVWKKQPREKRHNLVATLEKHVSAVNALAISEDDTVLYSGACDRSILVWERNRIDDEHMVLAGALRGHSKAILCLAVVSDLVFSGSADKAIRVWRRGTDKGYSCLAALDGHSKPVKCLAVSLGSDSDVSCMVYSGSLDLSVKVWRIRIPLL